MLSLPEKERVASLIEGGVSRAADKLGRLSRTEWGVVSSSTDEVPIVRLLSSFSRQEGEHVAAALRAEADIPTEVVLLFSARSAQAVSAAVTRPWEAAMRALPNLVELTIGEVSNILAQSVIGGLADELGRTVILSVPGVRRGRKADLLGSALERYDGRRDVLLSSHVELYSAELAADCSMVLACDSGVLHKLLSGARV